MGFNETVWSFDEWLSESPSYLAQRVYPVVQEKA